MDYRWLDLNREPVWINCRGYIIRGDQQEPIYLIGCINEIGNRQKADNITGLLGETSLEKYFKNSVSTLNKGFLIHVGIDGFKMINEKLWMGLRRLHSSRNSVLHLILYLG